MTETASSVKSILSRDSNGTGEFHFNNYSVDSNGTPNAGNSKIIMQHDTTDTNRILKFQIDDSNKLELESNSIKIYSSIIPDVNELRDIGSAEKKIRHLFLSSSSLWVGDEHKITVDDGKLKFRKRKTNYIPKSIVETFSGANDDEKRNAAISNRNTWAATHASGISLENMKLEHWKQYAKTINVGGKGIGNADIEDVFKNDEKDDYQEDNSSNIWTESGVNAHTLITNIGIGTTTPGTKLQITGAEPYLTLKNSTAENTDGGCESKIIFEDHGNNALGQIQVSHYGSADDTKGELIFSTNDGSSLGERMKISNEGNLLINYIYPLIDNSSTENIYIGKYFYANYYQGSFSTYVNDIKSQPWYGNQSLTKQIADSDKSWSRKNFIYNVNESTETIDYYDSYGNSTSSGHGSKNWGQKVTEFINNDFASWVSLKPIMSIHSNSVSGGYVEVKKLAVLNRIQDRKDNNTQVYGEIIFGDKIDSHNAKLSVDPGTPHIRFTSTTGPTSWLINVTKSYSEINFTGQHRIFFNDYSLNDLNSMKGLIVCANKNSYTQMYPNLCKGNKAIHIDESLPEVSLCNKDKDKSVFGVISNNEEHNNNRYEGFGNLKEDIAKESGDDRTYINSVGEGAVWVTDKNGNLESGDYITSCTIPGYGMKQDSDSLKNYTVAKITMDCDFNPVTQPVQQILKDSEGNNILDTNGYLQWENHATETEKAYNLRYLLANGTQITEADYNTRNSNGETVYKAAFVGCTYHCG